MSSTTSDEVARKIRNAIIVGKILPNERLIEEDLAKVFKISRTPVREAIKVLEKNGLVTVVPNKGATVSKIDFEQIKEIYVVRSSLESLAVKLATNKIPQEIFSSLSEMINEMDTILYDGDRRKFEKWNTEFHLTIYNYCGNKLLINLIKDLLNKSILFRRTSWLSQEHVTNAIESHKNLLKALMKRDEHKAQKIIEKHTILIEKTNEF